VTNNGAVAVDGVRAVLTYVDSGGTTVAQEHPMVNGSSIAAGATASGR